MKKVITLVLALAMVFAIAGSASALVADNALSTVNYSDRYALSIELTGGPVVRGGATLTIPSVVADKAYVKNEILYYAVTIVAKAAFNSATQIGDANLVITGNGVDIASYSDVKGYWYDATQSKGAEWKEVGNAMPWPWGGAYSRISFTPSPIYNTLTLDKAALNKIVAQTGPNRAKYDTNYVFSGMGLVTGTVAAPSVTAKIAMTAMNGDKAHNYANPTDYIGLGNSNIRITKQGDTIWQVTNVTPGVNKGVRFQANPATGKCTSIALVSSTETKEVTKGNYYNKATGAWTYGWLDKAGNLLSASDAALIDAIFSFMGFDYELRDTNAIREKDFIAKTSETNLVAVANANAYQDVVTVNTVTVVPEDIVVPKTGSAASFAGIALIVLAVAAAFVAKKVRA